VNLTVKIPVTLVGSNWLLGLLKCFFLLCVLCKVCVLTLLNCYCHGTCVSLVVRTILLMLYAYCWRSSTSPTAHHSLFSMKKIHQQVRKLLALCFQSDFKQCFK